MWRFRIGHPATSAEVATIYASAAQVTAAGLTITLDEWGGCKSASWTGLTGPQVDRARIWIDVQSGGAWVPLFSGALTSRPPAETRSGNWEAVGDKYLRFKELPVTQVNTGGGQTGSGTDVGAAIRALVTAILPDLPHLVVGDGAPDAGVPGKRDHNGEMVAAALDALIALKPGWGWTVKADDSLYLGPPVSLAVTVDAATPGVLLTLRNVVSEGLRNAIRWTYVLPDKGQVSYESRDATVTSLGRSSITRYIDARSINAVTDRPAVEYLYTFNDGTTYQATATSVGGADLRYIALRDGLLTTKVNVGQLSIRADILEDADWMDLQYDGQVGVAVRLIITRPDLSPEIIEPPAGSSLNSGIPNLPAGSTVLLERTTAGTLDGLGEFNPRRLRRVTLDAAALDLYRIPAQHAGTVTVTGREPPAGQVTVQRPGLTALTERVVGTRYVIRDPILTEYMLGEPDSAVDDQVLRVLVERRDEETLSQAVNTAGAA